MKTTMKLKHLSRLAALACACVAGAGQAAEPGAVESDRGYSYFIGLARQELRYQESVSAVPVKSSVRTGSPMLITGALFPLKDDLLVSIHSETTFFPGRSTETWSATAPTIPINGVNNVVTDPTLQTNGFNLSQSTNQLLGHYRLQHDAFVTGGVLLRSQSFKRFSFTPGKDNLVTTPANTTIEESSSEVLLNLGFDLESEVVRGRGNHYGLRATIGVPIWRRLENTENPQAQFDGTQGFDVALEGRYSWAVFRNAQVGAWGKYTLSRRGSQSQRIGSTTFELPSSRLDSVALGLEMLWKL